MILYQFPIFFQSSDHKVELKHELTIKSQCILPQNKKLSSIFLVPTVSLSRNPGNLAILTSLGAWCMRNSIRYLEENVLVQEMMSLACHDLLFGAGILNLTGSGGRGCGHG